MAAALTGGRIMLRTRPRACRMLWICTLIIKVSTYLWDTITSNAVQEFAEGDDEDGFVVETNIIVHTGTVVSYPKFTTPFGTQISFKYGVYKPEIEDYDIDRLKVINVPVLKTHMIYGVTGAVKHYMGVPS